MWVREEADLEKCPLNPDVKEARESSGHLGGRAFGRREQPRQGLGKSEQGVGERVQPQAKILAGGRCSSGEGPQPDSGVQ